MSRSIATGLGAVPLIATMSCGHADTTTRQSVSARSVTRSPGRAGAAGPLRCGLPPAPARLVDRDVHEEVDRLRDLDAGVPELRHRELEVLAAGGVPPLDPEARVALGVAGRAEHVVDPGRRILLEQQDRTPVVRHEVLARPWEEPVHVH